MIPTPDLALCATFWPLHPLWPDTPRDARTIATHEAGHLCTHLALDLPGDRLVATFDAATQQGEVHRYAADGEPWGRPGGPPLEEVIPPDPVHPPAPALQMAALQMAAMFAAGFAAEALLHGFAKQIEGFPAPLLRTPDGRGVDAYLSFAWPKTFGGPHWIAWRLALHTAEREWPWVERVAQHILAHGGCDDTEAFAMRSVTSH